MGLGRLSNIDALKTGVNSLISIISIGAGGSGISYFTYFFIKSLTAKNLDVVLPYSTFNLIFVSQLII